MLHCILFSTTAGYEHLAADYTLTQLMNGNAIFRIMTDQLVKAYNTESSVFSFGHWPFSAPNLVLKNISYEEIRVIRMELSVMKYHQVIEVYYKTYKYCMAIQTDDPSELNAKRHAFWQLLLEKRFGEQFAKKLGEAHEKGRPGTPEDNRVDDYNNEVAIQYARRNPDFNDPAEAVNAMWSQGLLEGYKDSVTPENMKKFKPCDSYTK